MKQLFSVFFVIISMNSVLGQNNDALRVELKGNVKSCVITSFQAIDKFGEIQKGIKYSSYKYTYNKCGFYLVWEALYGNTSNQQKTLYKYTDNCKRKKEISSYDKNGNLESKSIYNYNGIEAEHIEYDNMGKITQTTIIKTDSQGNDIYYKYNNPITGISEHFMAYNKNGNMIQEEEIAKKYNTHHFTYFKYDLNNNLITRTHTTGGEDVYVYDNKNNQIEYKHNNRTRELKKYDNNNNAIEVITLSSNGNETQTFEFNYDARNNWIKKISYTNGIVKGIIERVIEYY